MDPTRSSMWRFVVLLALLFSGCTSVRELRPGVYRISTAGNDTFGSPDLMRRLEDKAAELCGGKHSYTSTNVHSASDSAFVQGRQVLGGELAWEIACTWAPEEEARRLAEANKDFDRRHPEIRLASVVASEQEACRSAVPGLAPQPPVSLSLAPGEGAGADSPLRPGETTSAEVLRKFGCEGRIARMKDKGFIISIEYVYPPNRANLYLSFHEGLLRSAMISGLPVVLADGTNVTNSTLDQLQSRLGVARPLRPNTYEWRDHGLRVSFDPGGGRVLLVAIEKPAP